MEVAAKRRKMDHPSCRSDAPGLSSFHMEHLPEEIQSLVLSRLPLKEAARTSIVSRSWTKLWTHHPNLCFDGTKKYWSTDEDYVIIERAKFIDTVNSIIRQHSGIGLNEFSIRCNLQPESSDHLDRWIYFATAAKAKIIHIDLSSTRIIIGIITKWVCNRLNHFPLEALSSHGDSPFIESLLLKGVSVKPHSDLCGFAKLTRLLLHYVQIAGDFPGLLSKCSGLEDLEIIACTGVTGLNIAHQLNKLRRLLISRMRVQTVDFHVAGLVDFEYKGDVIPIALNGCSKLEKATITFRKDPMQDSKELWHAFTAIPSISAVKVLNMHAYMQEAFPVWPSQVHKVATACMFTNLKHLTCEIIIYTKRHNNHSELLKLAQYLAFAPQLETLHLHMMYQMSCDKYWQGEVALEGASCSLDHLKTVHMSGFRCYRAQVELLCCILDKAPVLEHVTIQPRVTMKCAHALNRIIPYTEIRQWAHDASERFGKVVTVAPYMRSP